MSEPFRKNRFQETLPNLRSEPLTLLFIFTTAHIVITANINVGTIQEK